MIQRHRSAALLLGVVLLAPLPALAQGGPGLLPPYEAVTIVRSTGLQPLSPPVLRGPNYVMRAIDRRGIEVRVVLDARDGEIIAVRPTRSAALAPPEDYHDRPAYRDRYDRLPPGAVYSDPNAPPPGGYQSRPMPQDAYRSGPPSIDQERPYPPGSVPGRYSSAPYSSAPSNGPEDEYDEPQVIPAPRGGERSGALPPPPDRFERRAPSSGPAPQSSRPPSQPRSASSARSPSAPPIPRPRPEVSATPQPAPSAVAPQDVAPLPPAVPDAQPDAGELPN